MKRVQNAISEALMQFILDAAGWTLKEVKDRFKDSRDPVSELASILWANREDWQGPYATYGAAEWWAKYLLEQAGVTSK